MIARAREAGVEAIINIGIDVATSRQAVDLASRHEKFFAAIGLHPTSSIDDLDEALEQLNALLAEDPEPIVAIGEIGLDYYWDTISPEEQEPRLLRQLDLALEHDLPVVYHCRDALDELLEHLETRDTRPPGVFHCFGGNTDHAHRALALGYHVSFAGNVTFPRALKLQEAARVVPLDRLLLETDCPFLAPQARRGKRNEPAFAAWTRDFLAELKGVSAAELERQTHDNTVALFSLTL